MPESFSVVCFIVLPSSHLSPHIEQTEKPWMTFGLQWTKFVWHIKFLILLFPTVDFAGDGGDAFEAPGSTPAGAGGGRQWSSLKNSASPPTAEEDERERTKSLPAYGLSSSETVEIWGFYVFI